MRRPPRAACWRRSFATLAKELEGEASEPASRTHGVKASLSDRDNIGELKRSPPFNRNAYALVQNSKQI
jgi:hypothetical protein